MIVTDVSPFKGSMMCVELSGGGLAQEMKIYIHSEIIRKHNVAKGMELSEEDADRLIYENDLRRARERALYLMESRDHSYRELFDKLEKNYSEDICFEVCNRLAEIGVINDRRYAEKICRQLYEVKKLGRYRVKQEMRLKGLSSEIIEEAMENFSEEDEPFGRLEKLVEQKYERYLTDRKGVEKVKNALARKGYSFGEIKEVLDLYDLDFDD